MSAAPKRKNLGCNRGSDSCNNLHTNLPNGQPMSIPLIDPALVRRRWDDEERRLEKLFKATGLEIHRLALERHREGVREKTGRLCE